MNCRSVFKQYITKQYNEWDPSTLSHNSVVIHPPLHPHLRRCASSLKEPAGETLRLRIALPSGASVTLAIVGFSDRLLDTAMPRRRVWPERRRVVLDYATEF